MANPSKQKGTSWETAIVRYLEAKGIDARRIVLHGNKDQGDIDVGTFNIEAKNCNHLSLAAWVDEAGVESGHAEKPVVVVAKRKGKTDPGEGYAVMPLKVLLDLLFVEVYDEER